jgi:tRNA-dihydrouridine synthase A
MSTSTPPLSVAPMMDCTDRHFRFLCRFLSRRVLLYTEMVTTHALLQGRDPKRFLDFSLVERPLVLQLGGDDPTALTECARLAEDWGYDEVNLNVGCPSDRVQAARFGACLMNHPDVVARCIAAMRRAVAIPVTIKHRIGVDDRDSYEAMRSFVDTVAAAGAERFSIHARKAWLSGLNPRQNRSVPPLRYDDVYRLKAERPNLSIEINGGINTLDEATAHLQRVDAVMIGRAAYRDPYLLAEVDQRFYGAEACAPPSREELVERLAPYVDEQVARGEHLTRITRHLLGLFAGQPGARVWRQVLTEQSRASLGLTGSEVLRRALAARSEALARRAS